MKKFSSTMKVSLPRTSRNRRLLNVTVFGLVAVALLILIPRIFGVAASVVMTPIVEIRHWFTESPANLPKYFRDRTALISEIEELQKEISGESSTALTVERLFRENEMLRALLSATESPRIAAGVIGRPTRMPYDVLIIDKGSEDSIREGAPVFVGHDQVIGFVAKVFTDSSIVTLASTPGFESTVYVFGPNIYTTGVGEGGGTIRVGVPQGIELSEGDLVVLPSIYSGIYGRIGAVESVPTQPEQYGYVSNDVAIQSIRWVSVGTVPLESVSFEEAKEAVEKAGRDILKAPVPVGILIELDSEESSATTSSSNDLIIEDNTSTSP